MKPTPEITWSLLHPRQPDPDYLREVIAAAADYHVDSFELCGEAHLSSGGIDGAIYFRDYPVAAAFRDRGAIAATIQGLRECIDLAHASGRPVYYWHREVMVPRPIVEGVAGLLDANGELDLLGEVYHALLRSKLREFFDHVPELDGLVLTLTESDYSVIHNSNATRYPPVEVVRAVVTTFVDELQRRGKRFILRSFGSIAQDYEEILAGAARVDARYEFEIETKITPYDFSPFLPFNRFLRRVGRTRLAAEYDSIGEFLGAGYLPAADPARVIEGVRYAERQAVDRHVIRVDRIGHATFTSTQAVNLLAFDRAIRDPGATAESVWREWADRYWPACAAEMTDLMRAGIELVKKTHFIDGHVIFHAFPIDPTMKWLKASGIFSAFSPGVSLQRHEGMWGICAEKFAPNRSALSREKDEAVEAADAGWEKLETLRPRLSTAEYRLAETAWRNATVITRLIRAWCRCVAAYIDDMAGARSDHPQLTDAIAGARVDFARVIDLSASNRSPATARPEVTNEYGGRERGDAGISDAYAKPLWTLVELLPLEFSGEECLRRSFLDRPGLTDFIVCGGLADDHRVRRYMHASHAMLVNGTPARVAGNRVFPNGFIEVQLAVTVGKPSTLIIAGDASATEVFHLTVNGQEMAGRFNADGVFEHPLEAPGPASDSNPFVTVRIQKRGTKYPAIYGIATVASLPFGPVDLKNKIGSRRLNDRSSQLL